MNLSPPKQAPERGTAPRLERSGDAIQSSISQWPGPIDPAGRSNRPDLP